MAKNEISILSLSDQTLDLTGFFHFYVKIDLQHPPAPNNLDLTGFHRFGVDKNKAPNKIIVYNII
jgi:hypothetical protein